jgi:DNA polymerase III alpha subunit
MSGACDRWGMRDRFTEEHIDECERDLLGMSLTSDVLDRAVPVRHRRQLLDEPTRSRWRRTTRRWRSPARSTAVKEWIDKKGETMAFVDLAYGPNHYSCTIFSHLYGEFAELIASRRPLLVTGEKSTHNGRVSIKVKGLPPDADGKVGLPPIMDFPPTSR